MAACRAEQHPHAYFYLKGTTGRLAGQIILFKRRFWEASSNTQRNASFKTKTDNRNRMHWTSMFLHFTSYFNHHESWQLLHCDFANVNLWWKLMHTGRKTVVLHHYLYHYHLCSNSLYYGGVSSWLVCTSCKQLKFLLLVVRSEVVFDSSNSERFHWRQWEAVVERKRKMFAFIDTGRHV